MTAGPSLWSSTWLALRSLLWTILLPGFFAGYVPWRFFGLGRTRFALDSPAQLVGLSCMGLGAVLLAACILEFARTGRGTLSPVDPPRHLVVRGLYRYVRNPMYISVTTIVLGETLVTRSAALGIYWAVWFLGVNLFVIGYEEPTLRRQFGASYDEYTKQVGRWFPRLNVKKGGSMRSTIVLLVVSFVLASGQARGQGSGTSPQERQEILNDQLTLPRANQLITAMEAMTRYVASLPDFQDRVVKSMKMTPAERRAQLENDPKAMAILKQNGLTAQEYLVGVPTLRMALMAAQGVNAPGVIASPANVAFAKAI